MSQVQTLIDKLNTMTTAEIRSLFQGEGIIGVIGHGNKCAIAQFLKLKAPDATVVSVTPVSVMWSDPMPGYARLSPSVQAFIVDFDRGRYPELAGYSGHTLYVQDFNAPTLVKPQQKELAGVA